MKHILNKITPKFILELEHRLLLSSPLAWQFQLPRILWFWMLITVLGSPVPFLMQLNLARYNNDMDVVVTYTIVFGILQFFLYGFILIQFNATKSFVSRRWWHGIVEQFVYLIVMFLCISQFLIYDAILDVRRANYLTEDQINQEILSINKARHYFMSDQNDYKYFADDKSYLTYMSTLRTDGKDDADQYYLFNVIPNISKYFSGSESDFKSIDSRYTRKSNGPKLYYVGLHFMKDSYFHYESNLFSSGGYFIESTNYTPYTFQLHKKTDQERLNEIRTFLGILKKYNDLSSDNTSLTFYNSEEVLSRYNSNQFQLTYYDSYNDSYMDNMSFYGIENVYEHVMDAKYNYWKNRLEQFIILLLVALPFSILLFVFKNSLLRPILLAILSVILLGIISVIFAVITNTKEHVIIYVPIVVFIIGMIMTINNSSSFSTVRVIWVIVANCAFAMAPIYLYFYFIEYLDLFKIPYEECRDNSTLCDENRRMLEAIGWVCFWGGLVFYLLVGSYIFKRAYERIWALPSKK